LRWVSMFLRRSKKSMHEGDWKERNPNHKDIEAILTEEYRTDVRWAKAVQHLRDNGQIEGSMKDIAFLIREVPADVLKDSEEEIKEKLFAHFWPKISRGITRGLPDWYKEELAKDAFQSKP